MRSTRKNEKRNSPGPNARNLRKQDLAAVIFGCRNHTIEECFTQMLFGLPAHHFPYVKNIEPGLPLFLFNCSDRMLHGIYEADGHGQRNINPHGWTVDESGKTEYPAQVRVRIRKQCQALSEKHFEKILRENYNNSYNNVDKKRFWFELDHTQTHQLISLFESLPSTSSSTTYPYNSSMRKPLHGAVTRNKDKYISTTAKAKACSEHFEMESGLQTKLPRQTHKNWAALFKQDNDTEVRSEDDDKPLVSEANWDGENTVCFDGLCIHSGNSGLAASWKETQCSDVSNSWGSGIAPGLDEAGSAIDPSWDYKEGCSGEDLFWGEEGNPSSINPSWEEEKQITVTQSEKLEYEDEAARLNCEMKRLTVDRGRSNLKEQTEPFASSGVDNLHLDGSSSGAPSSIGRGISNLEEDTEDAFLYCGVDGSQLDDERSLQVYLYSPKNNPEKDRNDSLVPCRRGKGNTHLEKKILPTPSTSEKYEEDTISSSHTQFVINQLKQELEEVKANSMDQDRKTSVLEKKLADSGILLQHLRHRLMLLESHMRGPSVAGVELYNDSQRNKQLADLFDEPRLGVDELIFVMGGYDGDSWLPTVDCYSLSKDIMKSFKPMSTIRSYASSVMLNSRIYTFGGWNSYSERWYDTVECYDPWSNEWTSCTPLSEKKGCLAGASLNNKIFALGGGNGIDCFNEVEMFDPTLGRWIPTQSMLQERFASAAAELDGVLYVVGGYDGNHYLKYAVGGYDGSKYVPSIEVFDPFMGAWLPGDDMKQSRGYFAAPVMGEAIYAFGGQTEGNTIVESVEIYRLGHGWSVTKLRGIGRRSFFSAVCVEL